MNSVKNLMNLDEKTKAIDAIAKKKSTVIIQAGITLSAGDIITVQAGTANAITFHAYGTEVTI